MTEHSDYSYFCNRNCEYFPCHRTNDTEYFNCLMCFCPLYHLGDECGGNFSYTVSGIKDCSNCLLPHSPGGYKYITKKLIEKEYDYTED